MKKKTVIVSGREWGADHERDFIASFPPRFVVNRVRTPLPGGGVGLTPFLYRCSECNDEYALWMTDDDIWEQLPKKHQKKSPCVPCFMKMWGKRPQVVKEYLRFKQIATGTFSYETDGGGHNHMLYALGQDGKVYEFCWREKVWRPMSMEMAVPKEAKR